MGTRKNRQATRRAKRKNVKRATNSSTGPNADGHVREERCTTKNVPPPIQNSDICGGCGCIKSIQTDLTTPSVSLDRLSKEKTSRHESNQSQLVTLFVLVQYVRTNVSVLYWTREDTPQSRVTDAVNALYDTRVCSDRTCDVTLNSASMNITDDGDGSYISNYEYSFCPDDVSLARSIPCAEFFTIADRCKKHK